MDAVKLRDIITSGYYLSTYGVPVDGGYRHFALTQLECASARQAYPCWDEPSMKASFAFTMVTVESLKCLSCMPETTSPRKFNLDWLRTLRKKAGRLSISRPHLP